MNYTITLEKEPRSEEMGALSQKNSAYAQAQGLDADVARQEIAIFVRNAAGEIIGGIYGGYSGSWMFIDTLWLHESLRGQGYGTKLIRAIEQAVAARGIHRTILGTSSFQAPEFYKKLGYSVVFLLEKLIRDADSYMMARRDIALIPDFKTELVVECPPNAEDVKFLNTALQAYNDSKIGAFNPTPIFVTLRDAAGVLVGGALGGVLEKASQVSCVWVDEALRGQGYGTRLLQTLLQSVSGQGARVMIGPAVGEQQAAFARRVGFQTPLQIEDYPAGYTTYFILKQDLTGG